MLLSVVLAVVLCHGTGMVTKTKPFPNVIPPHQDGLLQQLEKELKQHAHMANLLWARPQ